MHFSAEVSCRSVRDISALVPKCPLDTSAPLQKFETLRHQIHGAEMSWVRSVLGPKCLYTPDICPCWKFLLN